MSDSPFFHEASGAVRFWIVVDGKPFGASVSREALHHRYRPTMHDDEPLETYLANAADIEAAVRRRLAQGSREPVMLREYDSRVLGAEGQA
ncbi:MAG TPA: DUF1488 family protein [Ramlibacter sp.]|nr:DUF1488 family protein [Ramlibacter sp.]